MLFNNIVSELTAPVGNGLSNFSEDIRQVKSALGQLGLFKDNEMEDQDFITRDLDEGIKNFQRDKNLKVDGALFPKGETERELFGSGLVEVETKPKSKPKETKQSGTLLNLVEQILKPQSTTQRDVIADLREKQSLSNKAVPTPKKKPTVFDETPIPVDATGKAIREEIIIPKNKPEASKGFEKRTSIPEIEHDPVFDKFRERLKPREGGVADRSFNEDTGGLTNKGMSQVTLNALRDKFPEWDLPNKTTDLSDGEITRIFKYEYYDRIQIKKLNDIAGEHKTGSKLVEHIFDAGILANSDEVGRWLQESVDETIETDLRDGSGKYDGILGSKTRKALEQAVEEGRVKEISKKFADKRIEFLRSLHNYKKNPGWEPRVKNLRD